MTDRKTINEYMDICEELSRQNASLKARVEELEKAKDLKIAQADYNWDSIRNHNKYLEAENEDLKAQVKKLKKEKSDYKKHNKNLFEHNNKLKEQANEYEGLIELGRKNIIALKSDNKVRQHSDEAAQKLIKSLQAEIQRLKEPDMWHDDERSYDHEDFEMIEDNSEPLMRLFTIRGSKQVKTIWAFKSENGLFSFDTLEEAQEALASLQRQEAGE